MFLFNKDKVGLKVKIFNAEVMSRLQGSNPASSVVGAYC